MYKRLVKYGDYTEMHWKTLNGLKSVDSALRSIAELCMPEYNAWVCGGILEERETQDLDIILTGPNRPERINWLLEEIVKLGFENQIFIDIKYSLSGELFVPSLYNIDSGRQVFLWATYMPEINYNNRTFRYGIEKDGLYQSFQRLPLSKGYTPIDPILLT